MGMNIFGIGPFEFVLFLVIGLLILGPERMISATRGIARFIRNLLLSPTWRSVQQVQSEMRNLPNQLLREAGIDDVNKLVPTPEEIAKEAGLDVLAKQVDQVKHQVQGEWTQVNASIANPTVTTPQQPPKPPPVSPPSSGIPTISVPPPAAPRPDGPPTVQKS